MKLGRFTVAGYAIALLVGLGLILTYGAMEVSSTPAFCGTCHVMAPYYESWEMSSHANIACVDCHIPPGITAELRKKYEALSMVARYFTATYGTNPWTEVEDGACLECHERRLLAGREVFGDVLFDHGPHLTELRRGMKLQCTSCHSQIVQGSHISVTATTCTLCHFKNQPPAAGTAECTMCHETPTTTVDGEGLQFDHGDVERFGMACESCHTPPPPDSGGVPRERCVTCHNDPARLAEYASTDLLHRTHVSEHKVECTHCHLEIEHVAPRHLEAAQTECSTCHGGRHSPQRDLYAGLGGKGVPPNPDVMYRAGVRCEGCHLDHGGDGTGRAGEVSCMSCHGPDYRGLFRAWSETIERRTSGVRRALDGNRSLGKASAALLSDAEANLELVERGHGIHNVPYSLTVLDAAHRQINEARRLQGKSRLPVPWPVAPYETPCLECHAGVETLSGKVFGRSFSHRPHVVGKGIECSTCHRSHEERETSGQDHLKLSRASCSGCHHRTAKADCLSCHQGIQGTTFEVEWGDFDHSAHVEGMEMACSDCHGEAPRIGKADLAVCADCH